MLPMLLLALAASGSLAEFITNRSELKVIKSPADENVTVSYREPDGACTTASKDQKQYTGWVNVPGDYPTNLFFWFVEAREPTDSLTIWLNGGPGSSSMYGFFTATGPCEVVEKGLDEYETVAREWGWDRASNMIFIDQPNQVGFSYNTPRDGVWNILLDDITQPPPDYNSAYPDDGIAPWILNGTFSDVRRSQTANTTEIAATAVWHMIQGFLGAFPQYQPPTKGPVGINLFAESYGGRYGPIFAETFEEQNEKRDSGDLDPDTTLELHLVSLGIVNGCIDREIQVPQSVIFAHNNTYGVEALTEDEVELYLDVFSREDGCQDLLHQCAAAVKKDDPDGEGDENQVNYVCSEAQRRCNTVESAYYNAGRGAYDVAHDLADPFPPMYFLEYLNQGWVIEAIGSPVNFTMSSNVVYYEFYQTGDIARDGNVPRLAALLNSGVRIALIYGDRDYICNWFGGEAVSKSIAKEAGGAYEDGFAAAGYANIDVNDTYVGGAVRQFGNLSFSRIYQAGHAVPAYQPETAFQVFSRILAGSAVSSGEKVDLSDFATEGDDEATEMQDPPEAPEPTCFIRDFGGTCNGDAEAIWPEHDGVVINGVLYAEESDWPLAGNVTKTQTQTQTQTSDGPSPTETGTAAETDDPDDAASRPVPSLVAFCIALVVVQWLSLV